MIIDSLNGNLSSAEYADEGVGKGWTDDTPNFTAFEGAAGENEGQVLADAVDQVVVR